MSEQQNTALIQKMYAAFAKGDVQMILDSCTDDVEWTMEGPEIIPFAGKRRGRAQVNDFFVALATTQKDQKLTIDTYVAQGDHVATFGRYAATVTATGKAFDGAIAHLFKIRDGKVSLLLDFADTAAVADCYATASAAGR